MKCWLYARGAETVREVAEASAERAASSYVHDFVAMRARGDVALVVVEERPGGEHRYFRVELRWQLGPLELFRGEEVTQRTAERELLLDKSERRQRIGPSRGSA